MLSVHIDNDFCLYIYTDVHIAVAVFGHCTGIESAKDVMPDTATTKKGDKNCLLLVWSRSLMSPTMLTKNYCGVLSSGVCIEASQKH